MSLSPDRVLRRAAYAAATVVGRHPAVALPLARWLGQGVPPGPDTELVIEGYPQSGNHFAVAAFRLAQGRQVRVAHHTHAPAAVIAAVRLGLPTVVLLRPPDQAVADLVAIKPFLSVPGALRGYVRFYEPLLPYRRGFVVGAFEELRADFGAVIRRINERFGTAFAEFVPTEEAVWAAGQAEGEVAGERRRPGLPLIGRTTPPPGPVEARRRAAAGVYGAAALAGLRDRAERVHDLLLGPARSHAGG